MKIELCEDNGFMAEDGKPTLVVLVVTGANGAQRRVPYQADRTIQQLYADVHKMNINTSNVRDPIITADYNTVKELMQTAPNDLKKSYSDLTKIEREDIVRVFRQEKDLDGNVNEDIEVGKLYRVIDIYKVNGVLSHYDIMDDDKGNRMRIPVMPSEIELVSKAIKQPPRKMRPDILKVCECGHQNCLIQDEDNISVYKGQCEKCNALMIEEVVPNGRK